MTFRTLNRTRDTTTTTGTGPWTLSGTGPATYRSFADAVTGSLLAVNDTFAGIIIHRTANEWVEGLFQYSATNQVTMVRVLGGSNGGSAVTFSAGTKDVMISPMAQRSQGLFNVREFGAWGNCSFNGGTNAFVADGADDTQAFLDAIAAANAVYGDGRIFIPAGAYRVTAELALQHGLMEGEHRAGTWLIGDSATATDAIVKMSQSAQLRNISFAYPLARLTGSEAQGDRVCIKTNSTPNILQRTAIEKIGFYRCGTGVYDPASDGDCFSVAFRDFDMRYMTYRGFDMQGFRTGNVYENLYLGAEDSNTPNTDAIMVLGGVETEFTMSQVNCEHMTVENAVRFINAEGFVASLHIEGTTLRSTGKGMISISGGLPSFGSLSLNYFTATGANQMGVEVGSLAIDTGQWGAGALDGSGDIDVLTIQNLNISGPDGPGNSGTNTLVSTFKVFGRTSGQTSQIKLNLGDYRPLTYNATSAALLASLPIDASFELGSSPHLTSAASGDITPTHIHDLYVRTALSAACAINAPTGPVSHGRSILFRFKDNGTSRALNWNAIFRAMGVTMPAATTISKTTYVLAVYNATDTKWDVVYTATEA